LATATQVERLRVRWPSGATTQMENVSAGQIVKVVEPR
jgi:hypothetical protein